MNNSKQGNGNESHPPDSSPSNRSLSKARREIGKCAELLQGATDALATEFLSEAELIAGIDHVFRSIAHATRAVAFLSCHGAEAACLRGIKNQLGFSWLEKQTTFNPTAYTGKDGGS